MGQVRGSFEGWLLFLHSFLIFLDGPRRGDELDIGLPPLSLRGQWVFPHNMGQSTSISAARHVGLRGLHWISLRSRSASGPVSSDFRVRHRPPNYGSRGRAASICPADLCFRNFSLLAASPFDCHTISNPSSPNSLSFTFDHFLKKRSGSASSQATFRHPGRADQLPSVSVKCLLVPTPTSSFVPGTFCGAAGGPFTSLNLSLRGGFAAYNDPPFRWRLH